MQEQGQHALALLRQRKAARIVEAEALDVRMQLHAVQAQSAQRLLRQPARAGEVQLHAQLLQHGDGALQHGGELLLRQAGSAALRALGAAGGDQAGAGGVAHAQRRGKAQRGGIVRVQAAQRRVHGDDQPRRHGVPDALHGLVEAVDPHQCVVNGRVGAVKRDLYAVQTGVVQLGAQLRRQQLTVGVQAGDEPLGRVHQLRQVGAEGGFAAGERHLRNVGLPQAAEDVQPLLGGQLRRVRQGLAGGVAVQAFLVAVPRAAAAHGAEHQVHAVGRSHLRGIISQRQGPHLHGGLLPTGDGYQRGEHQLQVAGQSGL